MTGRKGNQQLYLHLIGGGGDNGKVRAFLYAETYLYALPVFIILSLLVVHG